MAPPPNPSHSLEKEELWKSGPLNQKAILSISETRELNAIQNSPITISERGVMRDPKAETMDETTQTPTVTVTSTPCRHGAMSRRPRKHILKIVSFSIKCSFLSDQKVPGSLANHDFNSRIRKRKLVFLPSCIIRIIVLFSPSLVQSK